MADADLIPSMKTKPLQVDLPPVELEALDRMAEQFGISAECLARVAISEKVTQQRVADLYANPLAKRREK